MLAFLTKYDIKNPVLLWTTVFVLYQIAFPILNTLGIKVFEYCSINEQYYMLSWVATVSFLIFYGSLENVKYSFGDLGLKLNTGFLKVFYIALCAICICASLFVVASGFSNKFELSNSSNFLVHLGDMAYNVIGIVSMFFIFSRNIEKKQKLSIAALTLLFVLFGMFTYGERSYVFNYVLMMSICYSVCRRVTMKKAAIALLGIVILFSMSSSLKMLFTNNTYIGSGGNDDNIIISFLDSDFASAGFNFNYLLNKEDGGVLSGKSYIYDVLSPLDDIIDVSQWSSTRWYTGQYWATRRTGLGFSIIGEGYANFAFFGIVFQMLLVARLIKFFYLRSNKSGYYFIIYVGLVALSSYSCRQALGNIISPWIKYYIVMVALMVLMNRIVAKRKLSA